MLECKICGAETVPEKKCCNGWECDCRALPVNDSEDYFCENCLPKYELIMSIEAIAYNKFTKEKTTHIEDDLIQLFKENKELFK